MIIAGYYIKTTLHPFTVIGTSMLPTYKSGQIVCTEPYASPDELQLDDVVIAKVQKEDGQTLIKRVVALPGDTIWIDNGCMYRNGVIVLDDFPPMEDGGIATQPYVVPENAFFLLGDNRNASFDSRNFGAVTFEEIAGRVT